MCAVYLDCRRLLWDKASVLQLAHGGEYHFEAHATIFKTSKAKRRKGQVRPTVSAFQKGLTRPLVMCIECEQGE